MPDETLEPGGEAEPTVEAMLLTRIDGYCRIFDQELEMLSRVTGQLDPARAASCAQAIGVCRIGVDELRLRAHGDDTDELEPGQ